MKVRLGNTARSGTGWPMCLCLTMAVVGPAVMAGGQVSAVGADIGVAALPAYGTPLSLATDAYDQLKGQTSVVLTDFALSDAESVDLALDQMTLFAPDATIVLGTDQGDVTMAAPPVAAFRGQIVGEPGTSVYLALTPDSVNGYINRGKTQYVISSGPVGENHVPVIYNPADLPEGLIDVSSVLCRADELIGTQVGVIGFGDGVDVRSGPCRIATVAIETDWEFRQIFGNDAAASAYATLLVGAASEIYSRDANVTLEISYLRIWSTSSDPWSGSDTIDQLYEFQDYWTTYMGGVSRELAHFFSGRGLGGGVAWLSVVCDMDYGYAVSANIGGWFPYPIQNNHASNWDLMVVTHEWGHNFGAPHTHSQTPQIDNCAGGDCSIVPNATIMSYCHLCTGGMANVRMEFHTQTIDSYILPYLNSIEWFCNIRGGSVAVTSDPVDAGACVDGEATFSVSASGTGLTYQWRKNYGNIGGAISSSYTIDPVSASDDATYDCVVTGDCGSATSAGATLNVCTPSENADLNDDCAVDLTDLGDLLLNFGMTGATRQQGDVNGDTVIDLTDLGDLLLAFDSTGCQP